MRSLKLLVITLALASTPALAGCQPAPGQEAALKVVTSTSLLEYIAQRVGGDHVQITSIVPAAQHPGDFDVSPKDIQALAEADVFLLHGWPGEAYAEGLIEAADNDGLTVSRIRVEGNWMTPPVQMEATDLVADALGREDADNAEAYQAAAQRYKEDVTAKAAEVQERASDAGLGGQAVLSAFFQAGFARWLGLRVVDTYGPPESLTPAKVQELVDRGREAGVVLVIDNLHSGRDAGVGIAEELGCAQVTLLNFPGGFPGTETWEKAIDRNMDLIIDAMDQ